MLSAGEGTAAEITHQSTVHVVNRHAHAILLLVDARHGVKEVDREIIALLNEAAVSFQIVLTKADKISAAALAQVTAATLAAATKAPAAYPHVIATSSEHGHGLDELRGTIVQVCEVL